MSKPVCEEGDVTVLWNQAVHTDREVTANRSDIIIKNIKEKTCTLIDVAMPADRNVQKEVEKKLKYKCLGVEIQRMWNLKCTIIPVIIGDTGIVTRSLKKNFETVPERHSIDSLQKTAVLVTSHIIRKVLQCEEPERWGSPLVHEKYQQEKACDERHPYLIIIVIIIIIIIIYNHIGHCTRTAVPANVKLKR